ncbi:MULTISPECIES: hypothetical protein [unclassified Sphingomonas]|uniref:hypothetical protein n=1 Tax=unclassified Sphingomonas TaxID=196159 RepID=UPI0006F56BCF|nr:MULTISPECIES: hypothetical protein [unclassified Sphingomonas]KQX23304.1 hypothetical protein ASD17_03030 [Sphingomonas sp. Root1294]KQY68152.1 hypothetical protein ASD39_05550 [Sphingomonas sp. Root50]KRB91045.1 hypothetical protein ASE22_12345 [Sphingomonas sp. Root720]
MIDQAAATPHNDEAGRSNKIFVLREKRHDVRIESHVRIALDSETADGDAITDVTLTNMSCGGFATEAGCLVAGTRVMLNVPLVGWRETDVLWVAETRAGCRFVTPLTHEELRTAISTDGSFAHCFPGMVPALAA